MCIYTTYKESNNGKCWPTSLAWLCLYQSRLINMLNSSYNSDLTYSHNNNNRYANNCKWKRVSIVLWFMMIYESFVVITNQTFMNHKNYKF